MTVLNSVLAGLLVLLCALWLWVLFNRLWQQSLRQDVAPALAALDALGLHLRPAGLRARLVAEGEVEGRAVRVEWRGGVRDPHSRVRANDVTRRYDLIVDVEPLRLALSEGRLVSVTTLGGD